jgi:hypothetical protein
MKLLLFTLIAAVALVVPVGAQPVADHLKCYNVKDPQVKATYTADVDGLTAEPGCLIKVPAKLACVPATKTNVTPTPPGGGGTGTPNSFFCYKVKCPKVVLPTLPGEDQFGNRTVTPSTAKLLCAPLAGPPTTTTQAPTTTTTTTTTTTSSSTTTTTLRFVNNGDGTVTDHQTGLQWEKKVAGSGCLHCVNDTYQWSNAIGGTAPDGGAFTYFLNTLNGGATGVGNCASADGSTITGGFNNHCDWRLPTIAELMSILGPTCGPTCIDPIFGPTAASSYWSSTSFNYPVPHYSALFVVFDGGGVGTDLKSSNFFVRAVRGGS